jgi:hypothetical protein
MEPDRTAAAAMAPDHPLPGPLLVDLVIRERLDTLSGVLDELEAAARAA